MLPDRVSNPGPLIYESGALPIALQTLNTGLIYSTLKCLSIGTLKTIDIPYIPNGKLMFFRCPSI